MKDYSFRRVVRKKLRGVMMFEWSSVLMKGDCQACVYYSLFGAL